MYWSFFKKKKCFLGIKRQTLVKHRKEKFQKVFHKLKAHPVWAMEGFSRDTCQSNDPG